MPPFLKAYGVTLMTNCKTCEGVGWVCENHIEQPWGGLSASAQACHCGGAGQPCETCNNDLHLTGFEGGAIIASVDPIPDGQRIH